jgi:hypothetical protein
VIPDEQSGGVTVAGGDPGQIQAIADWHQELADALELHYATITNAAQGLSSTWNGEAASSYYQLSRYVATHFLLTSQNASDMSNILNRYAAELENWQREGRTALHESEYWLKQQNTWETKLDQATTAVGDAQGAVSTAQRNLATAQTSGSNPLMGSPLLLAHDVAGAQTALTNAQTALTQAQTEERQALKELQHCAQEAMRWQQRGRQIWLQATHAGEAICGQVGRLPIAPPPLAGWARPDQYTRAMNAPHGGVLDTVLNVIQDGAGIIGGIGAICAATMFWNPVGDGCGVVSEGSGGVSAADGWLAHAVGDGSTGSAVLDTGLAFTGHLGSGLVKDGSDPVEGGPGGLLDPNKTVDSGRGLAGAGLEFGAGTASGGAGVASAQGSSSGGGRRPS